MNIYSFTIINALRRTLFVPSTFVQTASIGKNSHEGTCLRAAAENMDLASGRETPPSSLLSVPQAHGSDGSCP